MSDFLQSLNSRQREAVTYRDGGMLVLAGAGSGKTRVLISRVISLLTEDPMNARRILAVTFTNKAAREMRTRIEAALPTRPDGLLLGTFHGICHRLLRIHAATAGLDKNFQVLDSGDQLGFIRRLMREHNVDDKEFPPPEVRHYIAAAKESGTRAAAAPVYNQRSEAFAKLYGLYEAACRRESKVDFAELILATLELWRGNEELRAHYARRFRHVLVDELQDTNGQQFDWLCLLDSGDNQFFGVGDDDQSIYGFRGAEPGVMRRFQSRLRAEKLVRLEENYRSARNILDAANQLISANKERLGKELTTAAAAGAPVTVAAALTDVEEAQEVAHLARAHLRDGGAATDIAVLYRTNAQGRLFEKAMMENAVPYRVYGGLRFYDRMEVKHALAYLRLVGGDDKDALLRVINTPPRGIGEKTAAALFTADSPFAALSESVNSKVATFRALLASLRAAYLPPSHGAAAVKNTLWEDDTRRERDRDEKAAGTLSELVRAVVEKSGLLAYYEQRQNEERAENLRELVNAAAQFEENWQADEGEDDVLAAFLATAALESGGEETTAAAAVSLMTVHAAKGLEFKRVFIVGMEDGLFPHANSLDSAKHSALEEERRLLYVALTRAEQTLSLHFARQRMMYGKTDYHLPSRFLDELPSATLSDMNWRRREEKPPPPPPTRWYAPSSAAAATTTNGDYRIGDWVCHAKYGNGVVIKRSGNGDEALVDIMFKKLGTKQFKAALAPIKKI